MATCSSSSSHTITTSSEESIEIDASDEEDCPGSTSSEETQERSMVVSILDRLKSPTLSEISQSRKTKCNPPTGKRKCRGRLSCDPKGVSASQRVQEFDNENFTVSQGCLFCSACHEQLSLKRSIIKNHVQSLKHQKIKQRLLSKEKREQDIAKSLRQYNDENHPRGETLPESQQVYRVKVVMAFLKAGMPLSKIESFRSILEENSFRLTDRRSMHDYVPFVLKEKEN